MLFRLLQILFAILLVGAAGGCGSAVNQLRENRDPLVRHARDLKSAGDIDAAVKAYNEALDKHGDLPQVHFELAAIYDQDRKDYVRAIYHYQRFLELNPTSQKTNLVSMQIRRARMEFAASLPDRPSDAVQTIAAMAKERDLLKARIADIQIEVDKLKGRGLSQVQSTGVVSRVVPASTSNVTVPVVAGGASATATNPPAAAETYLVKQGDTLAKIAREYFHDPGMAHAIFEFNKSTMKSERDLKVGQKINLPPKRQPHGG
jgi:tetratricopeptide (TPR) repeat protein